MIESTFTGSLTAFNHGNSWNLVVIYYISLLLCSWSNDLLTPLMLTPDPFDVDPWPTDLLDVGPLSSYDVPHGFGRDVEFYHGLFRRGTLSLVLILIIVI